MPITQEFAKIRRRLRNQYNDKAKADTFAFKEAFRNGIKTFDERKRRFKRLDV